MGEARGLMVVMPAQGYQFPGGFTTTPERIGDFVVAGKQILWIHPISGIAYPITLPLSQKQKSLLQEVTFRKVSLLIEEDMRRKRAEVAVTKVFNGPFIEDTPVPYIGFKKLNIIGVAKEMEVADPLSPATWSLNDEPPTFVPFTTHKELMVTNARFVSNWNGQGWNQGSLEAKCDNREVERTVAHNPEHVPWPTCTCGIYSYNYKMIEWVISNDARFRYLPPKEQAKRFTLFPALYDTANVILSLGGYVIPFASGFRSSIAKIEAIIADNNTRFGVFTPEQPGVTGGFPHACKKDANLVTISYKWMADFYNVPIIHPLKIVDFVNSYKDRWGSG